MRWSNWKWRSPVNAMRACHTCKNCGQRDRIWIEVNGKFKLLNGDFTPHVCNPADVLLHAASDFKDCDE